MTERYPISISFDFYPSRLLNIPISTFLTDYNIAFKACKETNSYFDIDSGCGCFIPGVICMDFGGKLEFSEWNLPKPVRRPIKTAADIENLELPDVERTFSYRYNRGLFDLCAQDGQTPGIYISSIMERTAHLTGLQELLRLMRRSPEAAHMLMEKLEEYTFREVEHYYKIYPNSDFWVASAYSIEAQDLISPKDFYAFCAPYIVSLHRRMRELGISNFSEGLCGNHTRTLSFWKEDLNLPKGTGISVDSSMDFSSVSEYFGEDFMLAGSVSHDTLQYGNGEDVYKEAVGYIEKFHDRKGGFVLSPDSGLPYTTPECNIFALLKAAEDCLYLK